MDYFRTFANCLISKGVTRSIISDLQREISEFIPNSMVEIIEELNSNVSISDVVKMYCEEDEENEEIIREYISFLQKKNLGFYCEKDDFKRFPPLNLSFHSPSHITNIIIEIRKSNISQLQQIVSSLDILLCKNVNLVFYESLNFDDYKIISAFFENSVVENVEIVAKYEGNTNRELLEKISKEFIKLTRLTLFNAPEKEVIVQNSKILMDVILLKTQVTNFKFCGIVNMEYFDTNLPKILESINHNSCLHKKISIDIDGNIKNCPSMPQIFGNIKNILLEKAVAQKDFNKYWNITKDHIEICKDCEFRNICTDCRAYTERTHDKNGIDISKPLKCGYDPYKGEWTEWSTNPLKEKAIEYYGMQEFVKKDY